MKRKGWRGSTVALSACCALSCGGNVLESATSEGGGGQRGQTIGEGNQDGGGGPGAPSMTNRGEAGILPFLPPESVDGGPRELAPPVEVWIGESDLPLTIAPGGPPSIEAARLVLILQQTRDGITGTITFGEAPPPPPPTDPDELYPQGRVANFNFSGWLAYPIEGFEYTLGIVRRQDTVLFVQFSPGQLWDKWCALQPTYLHTDGVRVEYSCVPPGATTSDFGPNPNWRKADFCDGFPAPVCLCDVTNCTANVETIRTIELIPDGNDLVGQTEPGSDTGGVTGPPQANIRLRRVR